MGKPWGFSETHRHTKVQLTKPLPWKPGAEISMTKDQGCWKHLQEKVRSNYDTCCSLLFLLLGFTLPTAPKVDQLSNVQIIQFPSTTNWTENQPYENIKNTSLARFFRPCLWRHKIFGTQWSCFFGRFGPFGFGAFLFLQSSLVLQKKQLDYSNEPQTINVLMRRWVVWKFQASFEICWTCVAQYIYIHVELNSGSCQGNNGILKLAGTVWRQQKSKTYVCHEVFG